MLRCPHCQTPLTIQLKHALCTHHHQFDLSKEGYLNLYLHHGQNHGDNKQMIEAREVFLSAGHYQFLAQHLKQILPSQGVMADLGCGEGYYTKQVPLSGYGLDLSKEAIKKASKKDKNHQYLVASIARLPFEDHCLDCCINLFAPKFLDEIVRCTKPNGLVILVDVGETHLLELKQQLYPTVRLNRLEEINHPSLKLVETRRCQKQLELDQPDLINLVNMTPYLYKTSPKQIEKVYQLPHLSVQAQFIIRVYQVV